MNIVNSYLKKRSSRIRVLDLKETHFNKCTGMGGSVSWEDNLPDKGTRESWQWVKETIIKAQ